MFHRDISILKWDLSLGMNLLAAAINAAEKNNPIAPIDLDNSHYSKPLAGRRRHTA